MQVSEEGRNLGWIIESERGDRIGWSVYGDAATNEGDGGDYEQSGINARLIAAAPAMYEALRECLAELEWLQMGPFPAKVSKRVQVVSAAQHAREAIEATEPGHAREVR